VGNGGKPSRSILLLSQFGKLQIVRIIGKAATLFQAQSGNKAEGRDRWEARLLGYHGRGEALTRPFPQAHPAPRATYVEGKTEAGSASASKSPAR